MSEVEDTVARPCTVCTSPKRAEFDALLISGVPVSTALEDSKFGDWSASAAYRHKARHLSATVLRERRASADLGTGDLVTVLAESLADIQAVRGSALASGSTGLLLRSADATLKTANALADRLGIDAVEVARELRESEQFARAFTTVLRRRPDLAVAVVGAMVEELDGVHGADALAADLQNVVAIATLQLENQK